VAFISDVITSTKTKGGHMIGSTFLILRGIVGLIAGIVAFLWPGITIAVLVIIFGFYAIIDGITNLVLGLTRSSPRDRPRWAVIVQGLVGIAAGVLTFLWPQITALVLVLFIGAWALVTGVLEIIAAVRLRRVITGEWLLLLSGVLSVAFGILVFLFPGAGAIGIAWVLGTYAAASGIVLVILGIRLRSHAAVMA
jgi:uncharacterized membrane protein HdeD (DUF308 family)